ncbi:MAG: PAS domain S-box protein [Gemmatimonadales bacterium]|nr:PAS domain S-box protein [Gemmatimonadales bacterium]
MTGEEANPAAPLARPIDSILEATDDGIVVVDLDGRCLHWNPAFCALWTLDPLEVKSGGWPAVERAIGTHLADPAPFHAMASARSADPAVGPDVLLGLRDGRWVEGRVRPYRLDGAIIGRVWRFRDVSAQRRVEADLRLSEERFSHLFLASPISILLATYPEGRIVDVNPAFCRLFERRREDVLGRTTHEIHLWANEADRERMLDQLRREGRVDGMEFPFTTEAGDLRTVYLSIERVQLHGEWHSLASSVDITALKRIDAALQASEIRYRTLFDTIRETIYVLSPDGRFSEMNQGFEAATGWHREEWVGRPFIDIIHPEDQTRAMAMFTNVVGGAQEEATDFRILCKGGGWILAECTPVRAIVEGDRLVGFLGTGRDVTAQRQLESGLRQAQKLEALGTLAGGIAHDFNNILTAIVGHAECLRRDDVLSLGQAADVRGILAAAARAKSLVRQILTFSRRQPEERRPISLEPVIREAVGLLRATMPTTISIEVAIDPAGGLIEADPTRIHQVIINLGTNALHAMLGTGGTMRVAMRPVNLTEAAIVARSVAIRPGRYLEVTIGDTGHGMPEDVLRRAFDPFFTTKSPAEGTGLGLAVVHGIMQSHDGAVSIESQEGHGTTATLLFPLVAATAIPEPRATPIPTPGRGQRILVVDDERQLVVLATRMLERLGYTPIGFESPVDALAAFSADPDGFDVVMSDFTMPGLPGDELARRLVAIRPNLPVILASGYLGTLDTGDLARAGVREFVPKPYEFEALAEVLSRCLGQAPTA